MLLLGIITKDMISHLVYVLCVSLNAVLYNTVTEYTTSEHEFTHVHDCCINPT